MVEDDAAALRSMGNSEPWGLDELLVGLLKVGLHYYPTVLLEFHQVIIRVWREEAVP